jgi:hypothetical protein
VLRAFRDLGELLEGILGSGSWLGGEDEDGLLRLGRQVEVLVGERDRSDSGVDIPADSVTIEPNVVVRLTFGEGLASA